METANRTVFQYVSAGWVGLRMLAPYIATDRWPLMLSALLIVLVSIVGVVPAILGGRTIDALTHGDLRALGWLLVGTMALQLTLTFVGSYQARLLLIWQNKIGIIIKKDVFGRIHRARLRDLSALGLGQMLNRVEGDVEAAVVAVTSLAPLVSAALTLLVVLVAMPITNVRLSIIGIIILPLWVATVLPLGKRISEAGRRLSHARDAYITLLMDSLALAGLIRIKGFRTYDREARNIVDRCEGFMQTKLEQYDATRSTLLWQSLLMATAPACIMWFGASLIATGQCTLGVLMTFAGFFGRAFQPATQIANVGSTVMGLAVNTERLADLLQLEPEASDGYPLTTASASFNVDGVTFAYENGVPVLSNVSFTVGLSEQVVVMGPSGCGKTTLLHLLLRYNDADSGTILFCGTDVSSIRIDDLRKHVGYVPQDPQIFHATIYDNLVYGAPDVGPAELEEAIAICQLRDFIDERPEGLHAMLTAQGSVVSGGQRQRIAIARALLMKPVALLLDEATSALNVETEQKLFEALLRAHPSLTMLIVSHRPCKSLEGLRTVQLGAERRLAVA